MRHHTSCFQAFSNHLLRGGASERERVWKPAGGFRASLDRVNGVWARGGRRLLNSDKEFALTMGADAESLKAGAGDGEGCKGRREGEKQLPRQHTQMNSKNFIRTQMRKRFIPNTRECDENVIISFSRRFKTSTSDNCALTPFYGVKIFLE